MESFCITDALKQKFFEPIVGKFFTSILYQQKYHNTLHTNTVHIYVCKTFNHPSLWNQTFNKTLEVNICLGG